MENDLEIPGWISQDGSMGLEYECLHLHPQKLTWNLEMVVSNRNLLFQGSIFRFHVCFGECTINLCQMYPSIPVPWSIWRWIWILFSGCFSTSQQTPFGAIWVLIDFLSNSEFFPKHKQMDGVQCTPSALKIISFLETPNPIRSKWSTETNQHIHDSVGWTCLHKKLFLSPKVYKVEKRNLKHGCRTNPCEVNHF